MAIQITIPTPRIKLPRFKRPKPLASRWKFLIAIIVLASLGGGGWFVAHQLMAGPAIGTVMLPPEATQPKPQVELEQFDGTNFSIVHPLTMMRQDTKPQPNLSQLEAHSFVSTTLNGQYLSAIVSKLPSGSLTDDSSYYSRNQDPTNYKKKILVVKNEQVIVFTSSDGQQMIQAAFWAHGSKLLTVVLTSMEGDTASSVAEFTKIVQSLTWR